MEKKESPLREQEAQTKGQKDYTMNLVIVNTEIKQDAEGRYCLNDLHKSAGGEDKHRPSYFLKLVSTLGLIEEMEKDGIPSIESKQQLGTFACKELVYAYAMWISHKFHLQVIRAYDAMVNKQNTPLPTDPMSILKLTFDALSQTNERMALAENAITELKSNLKLENWQQERLQRAAANKVDQWLISGEVLTPFKKTAFQHIWGSIKRKFGIPRYNELPALKFDEAMQFILNLNCPA